MMRWPSYMLMTVLAISTVLPSLASAQDGETKVVKPTEPKHVYLRLLRGKELLNEAGEVIGPIDDLIIDFVNFKVTFAVVSTGGYLGLGSRWTAVPYSLIRWHINEESEEQELVANINRHQIEMAPTFYYDQLNTHLADENWRRQTKEAFGTYPEGAMLKALKLAGERVVTDQSGSPKMKGSADRFRPSRELHDLQIMVRSVAAEPKTPETGMKDMMPVAQVRAGDVHACVLDLKKGLLTAFILDLPQKLEKESNQILVPVSALEELVNPEEPNQRLCSKDLKKAPRLQQDAIASLQDEKSCKELRSYYGPDSKL